MKNTFFEEASQADGPRPPKSQQAFMGTSEKERIFQKKLCYNSDMRFQVPQFIEIEDKVVGPLTIKQFVYLAGGAGMAFVAYRFLPLFLSIFAVPVFVALAAALAFYKVNNKPFIDLLEAGFSFYTGEKLYIWKKKDNKPVAKQVAPTETPQIYVPKLSDSKLKDLAWSLDVNENTRR